MSRIILVVLGFLFLILGSSCRPQKTVVEYRDVKVYDTIERTVEKIIEGPEVIEVMYKNICKDSLTPAPIRYRHIVKTDTIRVDIVDGNLVIKHNKAEQTIQEKESYIQKLSRELEQVRKETILKKDWKSLLFILAAFLAGYGLRTLIKK